MKNNKLKHITKLNKKIGFDLGIFQKCPIKGGKAFLRYNQNNEGVKMKDFFLHLKDKFSRPIEEEDGMEQNDTYVELGNAPQKEDSGSKVIVRPFVIEEFEDIKEILDVLREGSTIALVNIKPLKDKDLIELKRAISKLRKTCEAIDGDIAGFGEDYVMAVPYFARIHRNKSQVLPD